MEVQTTLRKIHMVFKTHLDVGFTNFAGEVVQQYFTRYIPAALRVAEELRAAGSSERFTWTTGSWLIYEYLEQASAEERARMERAIRAGDIAWHGIPVTLHSELMDPGLFRFGLSLSKELDERYGRTTIAAKMTDVPGHTRGIVPLLAEAGIRFLHIGVNGASTPPDVPPVFRWRDPGGAEVMVMYHEGYGDLMLVPGLDEAIAFAHTGDNLGPQNPEQILSIYKQMRERFPGVEVVASTLDGFALALERIREQLPVVTGEIGDTWIHGAGSDPWKVARFRELLRLRQSWLDGGRADANDAHFKAFSRWLLLAPEHTWGLDEKTHLADPENFSAEAFRAVRGQANFQKMEASWEEQRAYLTRAVAALEGSPLHNEALAALRTLDVQRPDLPDLAGWTKIEDMSEIMETARFRLAFDARGALCLLEEKQSGRKLADAQHPVGLLTYQTFAKTDYDRFYQQYICDKRHTAEWSKPDFTKPGIERGGAVSKDWLPTLEAIYFRRDASSAQYLLKLALAKEAGERFGAPRVVFVQVNLPDAEAALSFDLRWFEKPACRMPEALWFSFCPIVSSPLSWRIEKMGEWISPREVVRDGNRHLHGCGRGVACSELAIESQDAPLVAPGQRSLLNFNNRLPAMRAPGAGMHFLLMDNVWGTNFRMWFEEDSRFRFKVFVGKQF